jgi:type VI secretion system protein ImpC
MVAMPDDLPVEAPRGSAAGGQIDEILRKIFVQLYEDQTLKSMEAAWGGLRLLLDQMSTDDDVEVHIVPIALGTLEDTLVELTGQVLEQLPSLVLVDLPFDSSSRSVELLERVAKFSEMLLVPGITWVTPMFFNCDSWYGVQKLMYLPHYVEDPAFAKWRSLTTASCASWLAVCCLRFLTRYPYGPDNKPRSIYFDEKTLLWVSPVWAVGSLITQSFVRKGWPTHFAEWKEMQLEDLPLDMDDPRRPLPVEAQFDRDRMEQLRRCGIIPLAATTGKDVAFIPSETTAGGVPLSYQLLVSRVTHLIIWCKDHLRKDLSEQDLEAELRRIIMVFWQERGHPGPEHLEISANKPDAQGRIPLKIRLEPNLKIPAPRNLIELEFLW